MKKTGILESGMIAAEATLLSVVNDITNNMFTVEIPALSVVQIEYSFDAFTLIDEFNAADIVMMQKYLLKAGTLADWKAVGLYKDEKINIYDLILMKRKLLAWRTPEETEWSFEKINTAT